MVPVKPFCFVQIWIVPENFPGPNKSKPFLHSHLYTETTDLCLSIWPCTCDRSSSVNATFEVLAFYFLPRNLIFSCRTTQLHFPLSLVPASTTIPDSSPTLSVILCRQISVLNLCTRQTSHQSQIPFFIVLIIKSLTIKYPPFSNLKLESSVQYESAIQEVVPSICTESA